MARAYDRDLIGYGPNPPDPKWPNGARLTEADARHQGIKGRDLAAESMFEYGSRVGFWRLTRLFQERRLPLTIFGCALALERHPPAPEAIRSVRTDYPPK